MKKFTANYEKYSRTRRLLTIKDTSGTNLRTSHPQLLGKGCHYREEGFKHKILSQKEYITSEKVKKIELICLFCLSPS